MYMTNDEEVRAAARDRRADAELAAALEVPLAAVARAEREPGRWGAVARAALVLLGVLATLAVAWHRRGDDVPAQEPVRLEPAPLPGAIPYISDASRFANLPVEQAGLILDPKTAKDLTPLARFPGLRALTCMGLSDWPAGALASLAPLKRLESLTLGMAANCPAARLRELRELPNLRFLSLSMRAALGTEGAKALAELPALTTLTLSRVALDAATVRALSTLPKLEALALRAPDGCSEDVLVELRTLHRLRHLELGGMGTPREPGADDDRGTVGLTPRVARALAELPLLESVALRATAVSVAAIEALPARLQQFGITGSPHLGADVFAALKRFRDLRRLELDAGDRDSRWPGHSADPARDAWIDRQMNEAPPRDAAWSAQIALLRLPSVRELRYRGPLPVPLREALRGAPLTSLWLERSRGDVEFAATMPELEDLTLDSCDARIEDLQPLARSAKLRSLTLRWTTGAALADVRALLPKVTVVTHGL